MSTVSEIVPPAPSSKEMYDRQRALAQSAKPATFRLEAQLLDRGRTETVLAATDDLTVRLKVYASGGENELHAHPREDHMFVILQGSARFFGPDDETVDIGAHEGIMMPKGNFYRFIATSEEPLVLLRIGTPNRHRQQEPYRINRNGDPMEGDSEENKSFPPVFREGAFFGRP